MGDRTLAEHYEINFALGFGSFGTVYQARQLRTGQLVAVKILHPAPASAKSQAHRVARFRREMAICARLHHPNIVRFIDSGLSETGESYAVFEFLPGKTLAQVLSEQGPLAPLEARHLMLEILDGLSCAHAQGVVHRDIKPSNVMVVASGGRRNAVILDFGIGSYVDDDQGRLTATGDWLGSANYSAPEQIAGQAPSPRSDLYAWGLMFVECLTGEPVVRGFTLASTLWQHVSSEAVPVPPEIRETALGRLLDRVLVKDVGRRTVTAPELMRALEDCSLEDLALSPRPRGTTAPAPNGEVPRTRGTSPTALHVEGPSARDEPPTAAGHAHRGPFTAVCCEVSLSTVPEDDRVLAGMRAALHERARVIAQRFDGHPVAADGERIELQFRGPGAHEGVAGRAARAALEIAADLQGRTPLVNAEHGIRLVVRAGIHTTTAARGSAGTVRVSRIAAELCAHALAGRVLVSDAVREVIWGLFGCRRSGSLDTEAGAVAVFVVDAELSPQRMDPVSRTRSRMVGRQHELALLRERWQETRQGEGHVVLISGEPGIGKSRLLTELAIGLEGDPHQQLICRCTPENHASALAPVIELLEGMLRAPGEHRLDAADRARALAALLERHRLPLDEAYPVFAEMLALPHDPRYPLARVSPQRQREHTLHALVSLLSEIAERQPLLFVIEDLHWADATTHELVAALVREPPRRMLGIWSARPELTATWAGPDLLQIRLGSLSRDDSGALAMALAGDRGLEAGTLRALVDRCDGVPLFIEEMAHMVCEAGGGAAAVSAADGIPAAIPPTLRGLLGARLDRLGRARETAQVAAVIGREFEANLLLAASTLDAAAVRDDLDRLVGTGLVHHRRRMRGATYQFKHALVRDAVYDSCSENRRQAIHGRIAGALEARFPEVVQPRPDLLAHHHAAAGQRREAIEHAARAARLALQRSANAEAVAHARRALGWLDVFDDERERAQQELALNALLIPALLATQGWVGPEIKPTIERSRSLLARYGDGPYAVPAQWALLIYHHTRGQRRAAREVAEQILATATARGDQNQLVATLPPYAQCVGTEGRLDDSRAACERALALYDPALHATHVVEYGFDSKAFAMITLAYVLWLQGRPAQALARIEEAVAWARHVEHASSIALALFYVAMIMQPRGDRDTVLRVTREILDMDARYGLPAQAAYAALMHSWAVRDLPSLRGALDALQAAGLGLGLSAYRSLIVDLEMERGEFAAALAEVDAIHAVARETEEGYWLPEVLRMRGACLRALHPDALEDAERCFTQALDIARGQGSMALALRAATAQARLFADTGRREAAHRLLAPVVAWFDVGHEPSDRIDWPDLLAARQLCASLS